MEVLIAMHETNLHGEQAAELWPCHNPLVFSNPSVPRALGSFVLPTLTQPQDILLGLSTLTLTITQTLALMAAWHCGRCPHCPGGQRLKRFFHTNLLAGLSLQQRCPTPSMKRICQVRRQQSCASAMILLVCVLHILLSTT